MSDTSKRELIEAATWALIDYDTDVVDRGVSDEHYRERRAEVERVWAVFEQANPPSADEREALMLGACQMVCVRGEVSL